MRRREPRQDGVGLDEDVRGHARLAGENRGGRGVALVPAGETGHDDAGVDRNHRRVCSIVALTCSSVRGRQIALRARQPGRRHGAPRTWAPTRARSRSALALADLDHPPLLEAKTHAQRLRDDDPAGRIDGRSHVIIVPLRLTRARRHRENALLQGRARRSRSARTATVSHTRPPGRPRARLA